MLEGDAVMLITSHMPGKASHHPSTNKFTLLLRPPMPSRKTFVDLIVQSNAWGDMKKLGTAAMEI